MSRPSIIENKTYGFTSTRSIWNKQIKSKVHEDHPV